MLYDIIVINNELDFYFPIDYNFIHRNSVHTHLTIGNKPVSYYNKN